MDQIARHEVRGSRFERHEIRECEAKEAREPSTSFPLSKGWRGIAPMAGWISLRGSKYEVRGTRFEVRS